MPEIPYEDAEGEAFAWRLRAWMVDESSNSPGVLEFSHIGNETGVRHKSVQVRKNKQGMRKGVPDYVCVIQRADGTRSLVWIELKRQKDGNGKTPSVVSADQKRWVRILNTVPNVAAHFAYGHEEACEILEKYINSEAP